MIVVFRNSVDLEFKSTNDVRKDGSELEVCELYSIISKVEGIKT